MEVNIELKFKKIYEEESDVIFRFCVTRVSNREQALDITQDTFLRLWQTLNNPEKEVGNNKAFLFTVAHHLIIDWYRKKKSLSLDGMMHIDGEADFDVPDESSHDNIGLGAEGRYLLDQINQLSPPHKQPLYLRYVEGLLPQEIGQVLGISANAASVRVNRALVELRKQTGYDINEK